MEKQKEKGVGVLEFHKPNGGGTYICSRNEYKRIYQNKEQIQVDFIDSLQSGDIDLQQFVEFIVSLMCEYVGEDGIKYFRLPSVRITNMGVEDAYYMFENNEIGISAGLFLQLTSSTNPSLNLLKLVDNVGHEMTHYKQFYNIVKKLLQDHNAHIEENEFFIQDDSIFDEWTLKVIRATLDMQTSKKIKKVDYDNLGLALNYNKYYLALCEKQARNGGMLFQNKMMSKWENTSIASSCVWGRMKKLHQKKYLQKTEQAYLKYAIKFNRSITNKFFELVPNLEELKRNSDLFHYRQNLLSKAIEELYTMSDEAILKSFWQAVRDGNDVMLPVLIDLIAERFPLEQTEKIMSKTLSFISKQSVLKQMDMTPAFVNILLSWTGFTSREIAQILYKSLEIRNVQMVEQFLSKKGNRAFVEKTVAHLVYRLIDVFDNAMLSIRRFESKIESECEESETLTKAEIIQHGQDLNYLLKICDILLPYLKKENFLHTEINRYHDCINKHLRKVIKHVKIVAKKNLVLSQNQENET